MKLKHLMALLFVFWAFALEAKLPEKEMVFIVPSYKNVHWHHANLHSLLSQEYDNYRIIYIDDHSPDSTGAVVESYLIDNMIPYQLIEFDESEDYRESILRFSEEVNREPHFFTLVINKKRCGALENITRAVHSCQDYEIAVTVDGDDWLHDPQVLDTLNEAYEGDVWMTHGTLIHYPTRVLGWSEPIPQDIIKRNAFREFKKCPSHLRTFYAWIYKKIKLEDLRYEGKFFPMTWDMAMMFPIAEMCGERHAFISRPVYWYNIVNQINDNKVNPQLQNNLDRYIRKMPRYERLED
ncbi:putative uncharacterized protein [Parachlamydia acanthamoebae UV-7]|uniref:Glycosyltransferase 2-like domain-containing protein n=2 Tax=Parachlamydia acanthamoebae TaxID=83552 RepID=F8KUR2_PARAV|nr:glycosyltransferase [Parachlamydia acanthamoebae]KIA76552.1 hypothetical protein DB43_AB00170 [Parachlamydia acanthamoebae]CCB84977.1 putative uncharacterized protein [Parachlamydia acanthamoebae UV-7]